MNTWAKNAAKNLLPLSKEKNDLKSALIEWFYTGYTYDLEEPRERCQLCDHPDIRFQFEIQNRETKSTLLIGSECILRFEITAISDDGKLLNVKQSKKKVSHDRRVMILDARAKRMLNSLVELSDKDREFEIDNFIEYYQDRRAFTPNQLSLLLWRFKECNVAYNATDFPMIIMRKREKEQLTSMERWKVRKLWPSMSSTQKDFYNEFIGL